MKVLHVTADWKWTGPAEPMLNAILGLRARGHQVDLACPPAPDGYSGALLERAAERSVEPAHLLGRGQGYLPVRDARELVRLRRFLADGGYDLIHVHHSRDHWLAYRALSSPSDRLVASWHRGEPLPANPFA